MGCFLALDYGTKRIGLAISDDLGIIASPLDTIHPNDLIEFIKNLKAKKTLEAVVIGMPKGLRGEDTNSTQQVRDLKINLERTFKDLEFILEDERFTSKMASQAMIQGNLKKSKRREKGMLDKVSASIILQSFLDQRRR